MEKQVMESDLAALATHYDSGKFADCLSLYEGKDEFVVIIDAKTALKKRGVGHGALSKLEAHLHKHGWKFFYANQRGL